VIDAPREIQWRIQTFTNTVYFSSQISLFQIFQCSYTALRVLIQLNWSQDSKKSGLNSAHQNVNLMLTLDPSRVQLACRSKVVCIDDMFVISVISQIYPILHKAQSTIKIFFQTLKLKTLRGSYKLQKTAANDKFENNKQYFHCSPLKSTPYLEIQTFGNANYLTGN